MPRENAPVAQLDRALDYESRGQEFESLRARQHLAEITSFFCVLSGGASTTLGRGSYMEAEDAKFSSQRSSLGPRNSFNHLAVSPQASDIALRHQAIGPAVIAWRYAE